MPKKPFVLQIDSRWTIGRRETWKVASKPLEIFRNRPSASRGGKRSRIHLMRVRVRLLKSLQRGMGARRQRNKAEKRQTRGDSHDATSIWSSSVAMVG